MQAAHPGTLLQSTLGLRGASWVLGVTTAPHFPAGWCNKAKGEQQGTARRGKRVAGGISVLGPAQGGDTHSGN